ncbi:MAG: hypothetical protein IH577_04600 [Deltaproteobacteria bacterium]|nr:hypothetical protein [Deltaproteobacteria bacterium]
MIVTEMGAKENWCPFPGMSARKNYDTDRCVASKCMAWQWSYTSAGNRLMVQSAHPTVCEACSGKGDMSDNAGELGACPECGGEGKIGHYEPGGYCGLVGKPEVAPW